MDDQPQFYRDADALPLGIPCLHDAQSRLEDIQNAEYKFVKILNLAYYRYLVLPLYSLCLYPRYGPKINYAENPTAWQFSLLTNILTPIILIGLGVILPVLAKKEQKKQSK